MTTAKGPVTIRENSTAGTPTSTVSGSASPRASPTGMKSQPTCGLIANRAGSEYCGGMSPWPISTPISVPTIWAITAPGPSSGESTGSEQMMEMASSPTRLEASGVRRSAIHVPIPVARMTPMISEMNAMKGRTLRITMSIDSRPAWYSAPTTPPTARPMRFSSPLIVSMSGPLRCGPLGDDLVVPWLLGAAGAPGDQHPGDRLGGDAADEDDDQADVEVADGQVADGQAERRDAGRDAGPDEQLTGVDVREQPERGMEEADRRVVEGRLVAFGEEPAHGVGHGVGEEEHGQHRQDQVPDRVVAEAGPPGHLADPVDPLRPDQLDQGVDGREEHDQQGDDPHHQADEGLAALAEHVDEVLGPLAEGLVDACHRRAAGEQGEVSHCFQLLPGHGDGWTPRRSGPRPGPSGGGPGPAPRPPARPRAARSGPAPAGRWRTR